MSGEEYLICLCLLEMALHPVITAIGLGVLLATAGAAFVGWQ